MLDNQEEINSFNKKINILENYRNSTDNLLKLKIKKLNQTNTDKDEQILYLN
jgi:hypothetical protein